MRVAAALLLWSATAAAKKDLPFDLPNGWQAAPALRTETAAAPVEDRVYELLPPAATSLRAQVIVYAGKIADGELETAASARHAARVKNRVAWGMKAQSGPPRESLHVTGRRAVRWRDRVGGALGTTEQIMTCVVAGARLTCVVTIGPDGARDDADAAAAHILASLKR